MVSLLYRKVRSIKEVLKEIELSIKAHTKAGIKIKTPSADYIFFSAVSAATIFIVLTICAFIFFHGWTFIKEVGWRTFLLGNLWDPEDGEFGVLSMIAGTVITTFLSLLLSAPFGLGAAIFLSRFCPKKLLPLFTSVIDLMASIPSVVFGFVALQTLVPFISNLFGGSGSCVLSAAVVLFSMTFCTVTSLSRQALEGVDKSLMDGSLALGATKEEGIITVELCAAKSGIIASIILAFCRAAGEAMAVIMVIGNQAIFPSSLFRGTRTLTTNIALEMGYAAGNHREALIACAAVLFLFVLLVNLAAGRLQNIQSRRNYEYKSKCNECQKTGRLLWQLSRVKGSNTSYQGARGDGTNWPERLREEHVLARS